MSDPPPPYNPNYAQPPPPSVATTYSNVAPPPSAGWAPPTTGYPPPPPPNTGYAGGHDYIPPPPPPVHASYTSGAYTNAGADVEYGGESPKSGELEFTNKSIRQGFIRKVFLLLTCQLAFVAGLVGLFVFEKNCQTFVRKNAWLYWVSYVTFFITYIVLVCCQSVRRRHPGNLICLAVLTAAMGYMVAMIASFYDVNVVFIALAITVLSCAAIIAFAMQTKYDFTGCIAIMFVVMMALFFFGIIILIVAVAFPQQIRIVYVVYCGLAAVAFMVYLAIDVQLVMGGKRFEISPEDYVFAATQLFLDIVYIFLYILQIVGFASK